MSFKHLGEIERGRRFPGLRIVAALERALELSPGELMRKAAEINGGSR